MDSLIHRYVRFCFDEYAIDPRGWITKNPPSIAEFASNYEHARVVRESPVECPYCNLPDLVSREDCDVCGGTGRFYFRLRTVNYEY